VTDIGNFLTIHIFIVGLATLAVGQKHNFALSNDRNNEELISSAKPYTRFFNIALLCGASSLCIIFYAVLKSEGLNLDTVTIDKHIVMITFLEMFLLAMTYVFCFFGGVCVKAIMYLLDRV